MTTRLSLTLHSLVFFLGILVFVAADDLVLPALTQTGPNDFLPPQLPQIEITNNTVPTDSSQNENSPTYDFKEKQNNVDEENGSSKTDTFGERLELPIDIVSSNLTSQPVASVATSESPQEQEDTEPSNKDLSNSEVIDGAQSGQPKNSVTIDNEDGGQLGQNNETEISNSNSTLSDFHGKNVAANYSQLPQENKLPVQYLSNIPSFDALHLSDLTENGSLERFIHNETVGITTAEINNTSVGIKDSDLLQTEGLNKSSSNNQSYQMHVHGGSQYSHVQQQQMPLSPQFQQSQPQKLSYNQTDTALLPELHTQPGNQQNVHVEPAEFLLQQTYNAELPVRKEDLPQQYHPQQQHQEQKEQSLELLPKLPLYQDSLKEQQLQEQKEQPIELPKLPLPQYSPNEQQQQPIEFPKLPLPQYSPKEEQQQPIELPKLPLPQYSPNEQQQQPIELPKLPLPQYSPKEQQQPLELPKPPLYQYGPKEQQQPQQLQQQQQQQQLQLLELPTPPLYQNGPKEQQHQIPQQQQQPLQQQQQQPLRQQQQPLELLKSTLYPYDLKKLQEQIQQLQQLKQQLQQQQQNLDSLELPKPPLYQYGLKEQQQPQHLQQQQLQPLKLPTPPLYQNGPEEQQQQIPQQQQQPLQQQLQPLELPKPPLYQHDPKQQQQKIEQQQLQQQQKHQQQEQPLELPKLPLYPYGVKEQQQQLQQQQQQPLELPKLPLYQNDPNEQLQQQQQQSLELPKLPLYQNDPNEQLQQQQQQPLELPKLPLYQNDPNEQLQQQQQQPLELPKLPLYQNDPNEQLQQQQQQPLELPKLPFYQYNLQQKQKEQSLELPKLTQYGDTQQEQAPQPQENKYRQAEELSQLPIEVAKLPSHMQKLPEHSQANGATSNDEGDIISLKTGGGMMSSDENEHHLSNYESPVSPLGKQEATDYRQNTKWKSVFKVNNEAQDEWYKEGNNDEGYYDDDAKDGEELKNNNWEGDKENSDDGYVNKEDTYSDEEELDDTEKTHADDDESGTAWDVDTSEDDDREDFNSEKIQLVEDVVDEDTVSRSRLPTAPTSMVVFYTWMIVAILIFVVGISMYRSHCHGFRFRLPGSKASSSGSDRKRLLDHEFV